MLWTHVSGLGKRRLPSRHNKRCEDSGRANLLDQSGGLYQSIGWQVERLGHGAPPQSCEFDKRERTGAAGRQPFA